VRCSVFACWRNHISVSGGYASEGARGGAFVPVDRAVESVGDLGREVAATGENVRHVRLAHSDPAGKVGGGRVAIGHMHDCSESGLCDLAGQGGACRFAECGYQFWFCCLFAWGHGCIFAPKSFSGMIVLEWIGGAWRFPWWRRVLFFGDESRIYR
jgi:hypothetical protein